MRDEMYYMKECPLKGKQATWLSLLEDGAICGGIFCKGIRNLLIIGSCK